MQLKSEAKLLTVIGLKTKHADCRITFVANTLVTCFNFSELIRKISPTHIFLGEICILNQRKFLVPIGSAAKELLTRH